MNKNPQQNIFVKEQKHFLAPFTPIHPNIEKRLLDFSFVFI